MIYYIREFVKCLPKHFQEPRRSDTVRRSLDGTLCILAFDEGTEPVEWNDKMNTEEIQSFLMSPENKGIWWTEDL